MDLVGDTFRGRDYEISGFGSGDGHSRIVRSCRNRIMVPPPPTPESVRSLRRFLPLSYVAPFVVPFLVLRGLTSRARVARNDFSEKQSAGFHVVLRCRIVDISRQPRTFLRSVVN